MKRLTSGRVLSAALLASTLFPVTVWAAAFQILETDALGTGTAHANRAEAQSASSQFNNPATMAVQTGRQASVAVTAIPVKIEFANSGSTSAIGTPASGNNGGNGGDTGIVPAAFFATDITPALRAGLSITAPFGLKTDWASGWVGRYMALESELMTIDINPSISWKASEQWALGFGVSAQRAKATLSRAVDFGSSCFATPGLGPLACSSVGILPESNDGVASLTGDSWGYGWNAGALYSWKKDGRLGASYRSKVDHSLEGQATYNNPALPGPFAALTATPATTNTGGATDITLPETLSVHYFNAIDAKWSIMADVSHTRWSRVKELRVRFANGAPDDVTPFNYKNTTRTAVGAAFKANEAWTLRTGLALDPSPVSDAERNPRVPDNDRTWLAFGASYQLNSNAKLDMAYARVKQKDGSSNLSGAGASVLRGQYSGHADMLSLQLSGSF